MLQCGKDTDCKGDRICDSGKCVNPGGSQISPIGEPYASSQVAAMPTASPSDSNVPKFKDYPAGPLYVGPAAKLSLSNDLAKDYRSELSEALTRKPVFAGEYVAAGWGCGTGCGIDVFVSKRTGKVLEETFGGEEGPFITEVRIDSRLIVAEGFALDGVDSETGYAVYFYVLEGDKLKLIRTIPIKRRPDNDVNDGFADNPLPMFDDSIGSDGL